MKGSMIAVGLLLSSSISWPVSITVPVDGSLVVVPITTAGNYYIYSESVWQWGGSSIITVADPEWMQYAANEAFGFNGWREVWDTHPWFGFGNDCNDLQVNGQFVDWEGLQSDGSYQVHVYSEVHQYRIEKHLDADVSFSVYDTDYHDNIGMLNVRVDSVPEASTFVMLILGLLSLWRYRRMRPQLQKA